MGLHKNSLHLFQRLFVMVFFIYLNSAAPANRTRIPIPIGIIHEKTDLTQHTLRCALELHTKNETRLEFQFLIDVINTADVFKLSKLVCNQFARGHLAMLVAVHPDSFDTLHSYANTFRMPFVSPNFPEKVLPTTDGEEDFAISILPDYHKAVIDTVIYYGWQNVIYLYDSDEGMLRLQQLFKSLIPGKQPFFRIANVKRVSAASEVVSYLRQVEKNDRWTNKYIILDSSTILAKETLIAHVHDVTLGRRTYHYLLSGLVMDDRWEKDIKEYGSINTTGFRILDHSRKFVHDALSQHFKMKTISAGYALMFDAAHILMTAWERIRRYNPLLLDSMVDNNSTSRYLNCEEQLVTPLRDGPRIVEIIKKTQVEGLTGLIKFTADGIRQNFSLYVVRNSPEGEMIPVATWYDYKGLVPTVQKLKYDAMGKFNRNKTYTVISVHESPYFVINQQASTASVSDEEVYYTGFCVDLAQLLAEKLGIKIKFKVSLDGKYGNNNNKVTGGWDGMIGQLVRKEVDMVIAPLVITAERETVVDFSKPVLSFHLKPTHRKNTKNTKFDFLKPFSTDTWYLIGVGILAVSFVQYLVSRFSPLEWKAVAVPDNAPGSDQNETPATMMTIVNEFNFINSMWFSIETIMQQGSSLVPRSYSGRIVSVVWSFFALIIVCYYTANLTSQITLENVVVPFAPITNKFSTCPMDLLEKSDVEQDSTKWGEILVKEKVTSNCDLVTTMDDAGFKEFAVAFPKGSKLRVGVNLALLALRDEGELKKLIKKWFTNDDCDNTLLQGGIELTLRQTSGLFYVLIFGSALGLVVALIEFCICHRSKANISMKTALQSGTHTKSEPDRPHRRHRGRDQDRNWNSGTGNAGAYAGEPPHHTTQDRADQTVRQQRSHLNVPTERHQQEESGTERRQSKRQVLASPHSLQHHDMPRTSSAERFIISKERQRAILEQLKYEELSLRNSLRSAVFHTREPNRTGGERSTR